MVATLLMLAFAVPAFGKAHNDTYPVPCSELWDAVTNTLGSAGDYTILATDESGMTASFLIVGSQRQRVNSLQLNAQDAGCALKVQIADSGFAIDDTGLFKKRVGRSLAKLEAAKPPASANPGEKK
jgi:hypothetical protein